MKPFIHVSVLFDDLLSYGLGPAHCKMQSLKFVSHNIYNTEILIVSLTYNNHVLPLSISLTSNLVNAKSIQTLFLTLFPFLSERHRTELIN